ncbi:DUF6529 family protein [Actinophytocola sp.]|uniref:DUF6529 family protein n=1 Tax=Actinophytocola sp. TaxID=1872138 RepID=UPI002ED426F1
MTLPPDFGPTGQLPETQWPDDDRWADADLPDLSPDTTQRVQNAPADYTQPVPAQWLNQSASTAAPLAFEDDDDEPEPQESGIRGVVAALSVGAFIAVGIGVYGKMHVGTGVAFNLAGFSSGLSAKAWLGSIAFVLAVIQVLSAMAMWGRLPGWSAGHGTALMHRWSGRLAVIVSLPVAAHCLYALGFQDFDTRVLMHSLLGCFFYGLFVCKMIVLTRSRTPGWVLPVVGAGVFTALVGLWATSSLWFFSEYGVKF